MVEQRATTTCYDLYSHFVSPIRFGHGVLHCAATTHPLTSCRPTPTISCRESQCQLQTGAVSIFSERNPAHRIRISSIRRGGGTNLTTLATRSLIYNRVEVATLTVPRWMAPPGSQITRRGPRPGREWRPTFRPDWTAPCHPVSYLSFVHSKLFYHLLGDSFS